MRKWVVVLCSAILLASLVAHVQAEDSKVTALKERLTAEIDSAGNASDAMKTFAKTNLIPQCTNPVFVEAVKAQNATNQSLDQIKQVDQEWTEAEDELPIHQELTSNACAEEIRKICQQFSAVGETFVMDNQGANVGQNELTSDYWQGDEPKWQDAYRDGTGGVAVSEAKLDKSTGEVDQKMSLPIIDADGSVIGAVCFGMNPNAL